MSTPGERVFEKLQDIEWFSRVGQPVEDPTVATVSTWLDAIHSLCGGYWEMKGYEAAILLEEAVKEADPARAAQWEELRERFELRVRPLVEERIRPLLRRGEPSPMAEMILAFDLAHICLEAEYADCVPPGFFTEKLNWYAKGHLPCGYAPDGKLLVF